MTQEAATRSPERPAHRTAQLAVAVVAGLVHLVVGWMYLASGLMAPGWAVVVLLTWWAVLAWWLVHAARRGSWWTPAVPAVAVVTWFAAMTVGEQLLGWTP